jgi:uncharacterized protein
MRFTQDSSGAVNLIRGYTSAEFRINDQRIANTVVVSADKIAIEPDLCDVGGLSDALAARILAWQPDVVLLGTGARQTFPSAAFTALFLQAGVGLEVMDTGAACRTFNVLMAEQRRVVAVLLR